MIAYANIKDHKTQQNHRNFKSLAWIVGKSGIYDTSSINRRDTRVPTQYLHTPSVPT